MACRPRFKVTICDLKAARPSLVSIPSGTISVRSTKWSQSGEQSGDQSINSRGLTLNRSHNFRKWSTVSARSPRRIFDPMLG